MKNWSSYARKVIGTGHENWIILSYPFLNGSVPEMLGECKYAWKTAPRPTWDARPVLQCLLLDTPLLEQQNAKKLCETKNNCAWATRTNSGQMVETKNQQPLLMGTEQKQGAAHALCTRHRRGAGGPPAHLHPDACTRPLYTAPPRGRWTTCPPPACRLHTSSLSPEGASSPCSTCYRPLLSRGSSKTLPEFLSWHLINFYWFRRARRACLAAPW